METTGTAVTFLAKPAGQKLGVKAHAYECCHTKNAAIAGEYGGHHEHQSFPRKRGDTKQRQRNGKHCFGHVQLIVANVKAIVVSPSLAERTNRETFGHSPASQVAYNAQKESFMSQKIGVIGSGQVGKVLAEGFKKHGHAVMIGSREPGKLKEWGATAGISTGDFAATAAFADIIVLAVKGGIAAEALGLAGAGNLRGKIVIDATNPIADAPPQDGVLRFFTDLNESLMEKLQKENPEALFVKAFSCVGNALMVNPQLPGGRPSMFIAGNDDAAKTTVTQILDTFGWDTEDMGKATAARAIEPLCMLWCIPGMLRGQWNHAFKLVRTR
jgi:8-hydroxy-5-deazaflavin:NADPH oxidoreductase